MARPARKAFQNPDWNDLTRRFPDGLHDQYDSISAVRVIVRLLQHAIRERGFLIALDETEMADDVPEAIILSDGGRTTLFRLGFRRPKLVSVAGGQVYVAHPGGVFALAEAITSEIQKVLDQ